MLDSAASTGRVAGFEFYDSSREPERRSPNIPVKLDLHLR